MTPRATTSLFGLLSLMTGMFAAPLLSTTGCIGGDICEDCAKHTQAAYRCFATEGQGDVDFCSGSQVLADLECFNRGGSGTEELDCSSNDEAGPLKEWPPGWPASEVHDISTGVFSASRELEIALLDDWSLLLNDSARFVAGPHDYFQLASVAPDDLWSQLGFQSGDVFVRLNGHDLAGFEAAWRAYDAVAFDTKFVVEYVRADRAATTTIVLE